MENPKDFKEELIKNANAIARPGFGILAADESTGTIGKRFAPIEVSLLISHVRSRIFLRIDKLIENCSSPQKALRTTLVGSSCSRKPWTSRQSQE